MSKIRIISWVFTVVFGLLFFFGWMKSLGVNTQYGSPGTSLPWVLGSLTFHSVVPIVFWVITYFVERKK